MPIDYVTKISTEKVKRSKKRVRKSRPAYIHREIERTKHISPRRRTRVKTLKLELFDAMTLASSDDDTIENDPAV